MTTSTVLFGGVTVRKANEVSPEGRGTFWTFYSQAGGGKTTLAADAANSMYGAPYLHIDVEGGIDAISHLSNIDFVEVFKWTELEKIVDELKKGSHPYKTICLDNLSEVVSQCLTDVTHNPTSAVQIQEYGQMTRRVLYKVRELRDISRLQAVNVIICAWDADEKDEKGVLKKDLALTPALRENYPGIVSAIGHIDVLRDPDKRLLSFATSPKSISKFRRAGDAASKKIPYEIYYGLDNLPMADIIDVMQGGKEWPTEKYPKPSTAQQ